MGLPLCFFLFFQASAVVTAGPLARATQAAVIVFKWASKYSGVLVPPLAGGPMVWVVGAVGSGWEGFMGRSGCYYFRLWYL